tara:strand:+ start:2037 stop:2291 length:255 start_codon:yes stop_codon:yes gene_type:complete
MQYFVLMEGEPIENCMNDTNLLGEDNGFGVFWAGTGLKALMNIVQNHEDYLIGKKVNIITDKGQEMTVEEFLKAIEKLKVRIPD